MRMSKDAAVFTGHLSQTSAKNEDIQPKSQKYCHPREKNELSACKETSRYD